MRRAVFLAAAVALSPRASAEGADWTVEISGLPSELAFPLAEGANVILTSTVAGGEAKSVWIATKADAKARYLLAPAGGGRYQVNLADKVLSAILTAWEGDREFRVFVEGPAGIVAESIAVRYEALKSGRTAPRVFVEAKGKRKEILHRTRGERFEELALRAHLSGSDLWVFPTELPGALRSGGARDAYYFPPADADAVDVAFEAGADRPAAEARAGEKTWPFRGTEKGGLRLDVTDEIRKVWRERGEIEVLAGEAGVKETRILLKAVPARLDLPGGRGEVTVTQRSSKEVPGSDGYLRIRIADISAGQALVEVRGCDGIAFVEETSLRAGEEVRFRLGEEEYALRMEKLKNFLIGDDFAAFSISNATPLEVDPQREREKIRRLIEILGSSGSRLICGDREYAAPEAAQVLARKYDAVRDEVRTLDEFILKVASRSWISGREYRIRTPDGRERTARVWLREEARKLDASGPESPPAEKAEEWL